MDPTEDLRMMAAAELNAAAAERDVLEDRHGDVWSHEEMKRDFEIRSYLAPLVFVKRKSDGVEGTLQFQDMPRYYFEFNPLKE